MSDDMDSYERRQIRRVMVEGADPGLGGNYLLKVTGCRAETKWLAISEEKLALLVELFEGKLS